MKKKKIKCSSTRIDLTSWVLFEIHRVDEWVEKLN